MLSKKIKKGVYGCTFYRSQGNICQALKLNQFVCIHMHSAADLFSIGSCIYFGGACYRPLMGHPHRRLIAAGRLIFRPTCFRPPVFVQS